MKKVTITNFLSKGLVLSALAAILILTSATRSMAQEGGKQSAPYTIKYMGTTNEGIVFNLKFDNPNASKFDVKLRNDDGEVFFHQQYKEKNFDGNIVLAKEAGAADLTFVISTGTANYSEKFKIKTTTRVVEEVIVSKN